MNTAAGKTYLITGGASLIGSHLADALLAAGAAGVRLFDNFALGTPETIAHLMREPRVTLIRGDVLRLAELLEASQGANGTFALAGFLTIPMLQNPGLGVQVNTVGLLNTLEAGASLPSRAWCSLPLLPLTATRRPTCCARMRRP